MTPIDRDQSVHCRFCAPREPDKQAVTVWNEAIGQNVCGLCGSAEIVPGYGLAGGGGLGAYNFCHHCQRVLDKTEDTGE
jgi:hypothetical protein